MAGLDNLSFLDDHNADDCQVMASDHYTNVNNKDWCKPLQASMARLGQMQPSVCNMFLQPAGSLKPPKSMTKPLRERKQQNSAQKRNGGNKFSSFGAREENEYFDVNQESSRSLSQNVAWGSNSSIPDLLARQKSHLSERPASASRFPPRNRPSSADRSRRPQSAKDFMCEKNEVAKDLGIKGSKKLMDSRMAGINRSNSELSMASKSNNTETTNFGHSVRMNSTDTSKVKENFDKSHQITKTNVKKEDELDLKTEQPEYSGSTENFTEEVCNPSVRASQEEDKPTTPPLPESIRFSLPNMNDDVEEDDDDELNTDRLLQQADSLMQKKYEQDQQVLNSLAEACATVPSAEMFSVNQTPDIHSYRDKLNDQDCPISSVAAYNSSNILSRDRHSCEKNDRNKSKNNPNHKQLPLSPHVTWNDSPTVCLFQTDSSTLSHNSKMQGTTSKPIETNKKDGYNKDMGVGGKSGSKDIKTETFKSHRQGFCTETNFLMPDESQVSYKPLEVNKSDRDRPNRLLKSSDNMKSYEPHKSDKTPSKPVSCLSQKSIFDGEDVTREKFPTHKLVPTVTLAYEDENEEEQPSNDNKHQRKKRSRIRKTFDEIETYMSRLDKEEFVKSKENLPSDLSHNCNCGDISCAELLAQENQPQFLDRPMSASKSSSSSVAGEKSSVVKTTKTIEFSDGNSPLETVIKNTLVAAHESKPEKPESRQRLDTSTLLKPSVIKQQQATEDKSKAKLKDTKRTALSTKKYSNNVLSSSQKVTSSALSEGGLAPPQTSDQLDKTIEEKNDPGLYESLLEEAKSMALTSMMEAAQTPTKMKKVVKPRPKISGSAEPEAKEFGVSKPRPFSAPLKIASSKASAGKTSESGSAPNNKHRYCQHHSSKGGNHSGIRRPQSAKPSSNLMRLDSISGQADDSPEMCHAQRMQMKMAAMGVHVDASVLERALFAPSGKSIHYNVPGDLPRNPTESLIPHYKHWLAEDYMRVKLMERRLARDDEIKYMQKVAAEKRALLQKKGKKKKKKEKCSVTTAG